MSADPVNSSDEAVEARLRELIEAVRAEDDPTFGSVDSVDNLIAAEVAWIQARAAAVRAEAVADPDAQPCTFCEGPTGNPDTFCDACKLDELEQECDRLRAKLAEAVADARRREAELLRDNLVINKATFTRTHPDSHLGHAPSIAYSELEAERDVLQQRIDEALVGLEETVRYDRQPTMDFSSTDALYNQFTSYLERVEQSWAQQATAVRAALTETGDTE